jgi:hypothetical protein
MVEGLGCIVGMARVAAVAEAVGVVLGVGLAAEALGRVVGVTLRVELRAAVNLDEIDPQFDMATKRTRQRATTMIPARITPVIRHALVERRGACLGTCETAGGGAGVPTPCNKGFPHAIQKRSVGSTWWPHFGQLVTLRGETGGGTGGDPGTC